MIKLQIKRSEYELIASGVKNVEYRAPSLFNKRILLKKNDNGAFDTNTTDKEIMFINGYKKDAPSVICEVISIIPVRFSSRFVDEKNNFTAEAGECSIEIKLGKILEGGI